MKTKIVCASLLLVLTPLSLAISGCDAEENNYANNSDVTSTTQTTEIKTNLTQSGRSTELDPYAAEAYYQQLLAQYGENYQECLEPVSVNLDSVTNSNASEVDPTEKITKMKQQNKIFVLDASDSMRVFTGSGTTKFDIAKAAIARFVSTFPSTTQVGVNIFGDRSADATTDPTTVCAASETMYSLVQLSSLILAPANEPTSEAEFKPIYKPITASLSRLNDILSDRDGASNQNIIYLITDGTDNCNGDAVAIARELHNSPAAITVNVIGLDENETTQQQLQAIAEAGGGEYFLARDANEFNTAFERTQKKIEAEKYTTIQLTENRPQPPTSSNPNINQITACTTVKMNRELGQIISQVNRLSALQGTNLKYNNHVLARLKERQERITTWRDRLLTNTGNPQIDLNLFRQELAQATQ
ncbi:vWA domain-containing protein [Chroococcidiopsis sp.]|uniref:vWA domain-containing protein n=1 Tax=Chroococcidiopsis sp. TaxID=3088168 RepID=UPI003F3A2364